MEMWKEIDKLWLAGLLEGEGSFAWTGTPCIALGMVDRDIVERAASLLGHIRVYQRRTPKGKSFYVVHLTGFRAAVAMSELRPYMGQRRQQAIDRVIGRWTRQGCSKKKPRTSLGESARWVVRQLQRRGHSQVNIANRLNCGIGPVRRALGKA